MPLHRPGLVTVAIVLAFGAFDLYRKAADAKPLDRLALLMLAGGAGLAVVATAALAFRPPARSPSVLRNRRVVVTTYAAGAFFTSAGSTAATAANADVAFSLAAMLFLPLAFVPNLVAPALPPFRVGFLVGTVSGAGLFLGQALHEAALVPPAPLTDEPAYLLLFVAVIFGAALGLLVGALAKLVAHVDPFDGAP